MKRFESFGEFAAHLAKLSVGGHELAKHVAEEAGKEVQKTAKGEIGFYQQAAGPFKAWPELAESTEAEKARLGFSVDAPLLRTGELERSIEYTVKSEGLEVEMAVGSNDQNMIYHELGTVRMPPRPVLGLAMHHSKDRIHRYIALTQFLWIAGQRWKWPKIKA